MGGILCTFKCYIHHVYPQEENFREFKDYRLTSPLSSVYKIIAKPLMLRLKLVMKGLISQFQGAFIESRQIFDSVLIANECIEDHRMLGKGGVIRKLDAEKTFDQVNWNFMDYILGQMSFGVKWRC